ncbi:YhcH/YjgK/YiaL family protein [Paenibacillus ginsengarvi]|uniref:YhcH/YjgK/YiaL family protein n=1 Tax=Paenibacillus ginsengarvi TaxID=400777 RepID=UPI0013154A92|nr:YhcH/YjgK/YiaL family protein [Paenibacillus ginsengarvi]
MILDSIANLGQYAGVHPRFKQAIEFLQTHDIKTLEPGRYEIDGSHLFANVQHYDTKLKADSIWEAHRKYYDIQIVAEGAETLGHSPIERAEETTAYNEESDYALFAANGDFFTLNEGYFVFFAPQDVHSPCVAVDEKPAPVKKIVIKVEI